MTTAQDQAQDLIDYLNTAIDLSHTINFDKSENWRNDPRLKSFEGARRNDHLEEDSRNEVLAYLDEALDYWMATYVSKHPVYDQKTYTFYANDFEPELYVEAVWDCHGNYMERAFVKCITHDDNISIPIKKDSPLWDEIESQIERQQEWYDQ